MNVFKANLCALLLWSGLLAIPGQGVMAAPPRHCDIKAGAWCIAQGTSEIHRVHDREGGFERYWTLRSAPVVDWTLTIREPWGCLDGLADTVELIHFQSSHEWKGRIWDRADVRLKSDGSCDLAVLFPLNEGTVLDWPVANGLLLIHVCTDASCDKRSLEELSKAIGAKRRPVASQD
ncbi:hypothetical protein LK540_23165 [Massilia sp. IC2-278]|uniref:hypothetical protein n=1 Tax=Massilia sp. IC2-278 TaxID=2887200 RepID=UPI001E349375|nr:hypothetical protein [Massilia sp. IC2-278]MCC2963342.1 hypothetical protein [Massilia sp. IC2-278]